MSGSNRVSPEPVPDGSNEVEQVETVELPQADPSPQKTLQKPAATGWEEEQTTHSPRQQTTEFQEPTASTRQQAPKTDWQEDDEEQTATGLAEDEQTTDLDEADEQKTGLLTEQTTDLQQRTTSLQGTINPQEQATTTTRPASAEEAARILTVASQENGEVADSGTPLWYSSGSSERVAAKVDPVHPQPVPRPGRMEEAHHSSQRPASASKNREQAVIIGGEWYGGSLASEVYNRKCVHIIVNITTSL